MYFFILNEFQLNTQGMVFLFHQMSLAREDSATSTLIALISYIRVIITIINIDWASVMC